MRSSRPLGRQDIAKDAGRLRVLIGTAGVPGAATDHGGLTGLGDDDHTQYVHLSAARTITAQHTFSPGVAQPPFVLSANAQSQLVTGLRADQLNKTVTAGSGLSGGGALTGNISLAVDLAAVSGLQLSSGLMIADTVAGAGLTIASKVLAVGAGAGLTVNADDVALTTPGTLSVSSTNAAAGNHTHAITSSSNPGAAAALLASNASGHLQLIRLGAGVTPSYPLHVQASSEQLRLQWDASNYASFTVGGGGNLTLAPSGDFIIDPTGNDVRPETNYDLNLGLINKKWLTLHAAELWVETLVAQNTIATIGGRILVGPTTVLITDLAAATTTILVKHNQMANGDVAYMEADGKVEFISMTSGPSVVPGGYQYSVARNLDGTGANDWYAGDAIFNTGTTGDGFIDLYSLQGVLSAGAGPTIVGNVRTGPSYNAWAERWALGNLNALYDYGATVYGFAAGDPSATWISIDATNGLRIMHNTSMKARWSTAGVILLGEEQASQSNVQISSGQMDFRVNTTSFMSLTTAGVLTVGRVAASQGNVQISSGQIDLRVNATSYMNLTTAGVLTVGRVAASQNNIQISSGAISIRNNTTERVGITAAGILTIKDSGGSAVFTFDSSAGAEITLPLSLGTGGGIYQGTGTFASPTTGLKIWNQSGIGRIAGFNSGSTQWSADTDGKFYAAGGNIVLSAAGLLVKQLAEASGYVTFTNADITTGTVKAFLNLQKTDPVGATTGVFNVGYYLDANNQTSISFYNDNITIGLLDAGVFSYTVQIYKTNMFLEGAFLKTDQHLAIKDGVTAPAALTGYARIYVDTADGDLKVKFADGVTKTLATDT